MKDNISVIPLRQPGSVGEPLTEIAREGARRMLATALEAEIEAFLDRFAEERLAGSAWFGTGTAPNGRSRPGLAPWSSGARRSAPR